MIKSSLFTLFSNSELKQFYDIVFDQSFEIHESSFSFSFLIWSFSFPDEGFSSSFYGVVDEIEYK